MACDLFTSFNHHFGFSLKLIFFKDFACSTASIVIINTHILWRKKMTYVFQKIVFEQTGSACNYVN